MMQETTTRIQEETAPSHSSSNTDHRSLRRTILLLSLTLLLFTTTFIISITTVYTKLNNRITSLTSTESKEHLKHSDLDHNITIELNNMTDVSNEIMKLKANLLSQSLQISELHHMIEFQINNTVQALNDTVTQVQSSVNENIKEVNENVSSQNSLMTFQFAGTFCILGTLISIYHILQHLRKLHAPTVQRKILSILWMVPIYSITSFLGLVFVKLQVITSVFHELYEAYTIYQFLALMIAILGRGDREAVISLLANRAEEMKPPIRLVPWKKREMFASARHKAEAVLDQCQFLAMQFVLLRPLTSLFMAIADALHESRWDPKYPQVWLWGVVNISIFFAFVGLVRFYHLVKKDLMWCNPFAKFLCIKGIVFMTFWQGLAISFVANAVYKNHEDVTASDYDSTVWSKRAQSFLICLEMFLFAIVHCFVFPTEEWEPGYQEKMKRRIKGTFGDTLALKDFVRDVKLVMRSKKGKRHRDKIPQTEEGVTEHEFTVSDSKSGSLDEESDIDWSQGWSRIEQYLELVEAESEEPDDFESPKKRTTRNAKEEHELSLTSNIDAPSMPSGSHGASIRQRSISKDADDDSPFEVV